MKRLFPVVCLVSCLIAVHSFAGSATWNPNPQDGDWNNAANWIPPTVPNGPNDVATFGASSITAISLNGSIELDSLVISAGASAFTFTKLPFTLTLSGAGIINDSGITQHFVTTGTPQTSFGNIYFEGSATAGTETIFTNNGSSITGPKGLIQFYDDASAGDATFVCNGGYMYFYDNSTAAHATITANGSSSNDVSYGLVSLGNGTAANATLIANDGTIAGGSIGIGFIGSEGSNTARLKLYGKGHLLTNYSTTTRVGSIEGDGIIILALTHAVTVGDDLSTTFSGVIRDDSPPIPEKSAPGGRRQRLPGGYFRKTGTGTLSLTGGANTYTGGTIVSSGGLIVANATGSATGAGKVTVEEGTLGGGGKIAGPTTIGTGSGAGGFVEPGKGANSPTALTIKNTLTFKGDSTYIWKLNTNRAKADNVIATGVTIEAGAQFSFNTVANKKLTAGKVFTALSNRSASAISGTFDNLADGSTVAVGVNKLQASYFGGDGNDLTLTVVP